MGQLCRVSDPITTIAQKAATCHHLERCLKTGRNNKAQAMSPMTKASVRFATDHRPTLVEATIRRPDTMGASRNPRRISKTAGIRMAASQLSAGTTRSPGDPRTVTKGADIKG